MENDVLHMMPPGRRKSIVNGYCLPRSGATDDSILASTSEDTNAVKTRPASVAGPVQMGDMPPPPHPNSQRPHNRSKSMAVSHTRSRGANRLSLSFPVQPPNAPSRFPSYTPTTPAASWKSPEIPTPIESTDFLVALASQERKVLELKEELSRAEVELDRLKRQWGQQEAMRKKNEGRQVEQLQTFRNMPTRSRTSTELASAARTSLESKGRPRNFSDVNGGPVKPPKRKVISGQRHTRTLSLLEAGRTNLRPTPDSREAGNGHGVNPQPQNPPAKGTVASPISADFPSPSSDQNSLTSPRIPQGAILQTGRQMAEDLKDGLWTFFEDLRQATVGDEALLDPTKPSAAQQHRARRQGSKSSLRSAGGRSPQLRGKQSESQLSRKGSTKSTKLAPLTRKNEEIGKDFWTTFGDKPPESPVSRARDRFNGKHTGSGSGFATDDDDLWSAWGDSTPGGSRPGSVVGDKAVTAPTQAPRAASPSPRWSSSTAVSSADRSPPAGGGAGGAEQKPQLARQGEKGATDEMKDRRKDEIPWPQLQKLSPSHLKRTASNLMTEWERSLTPPAESPERG